MRRTTRTGTARDRPEPDWGPLEQAVPHEHLGDFMWMFEVELSDGTIVQAYKHWETRRYLHLSAAGAAFVFEAPDRYVPVDVEWLVDLALPRAS